MQFASAPDDEDDVDHTIDLDNDNSSNQNGVYVYNGAIGSSETVEFKAIENPTTGYSYMIDSNDCGARLRQTDTQYVKPEG